MRLGVIKLGSRIAFGRNDTSGASGEARSCLAALKKGGADIDVYTKIIKKDNLVPDYTWHNLAKMSKDDCKKIKADALIVINGRPQYYGGAEDREQLLNYLMINSFQGPVIYFYCDPELTLAQTWPSVTKKEWRSNWEEDEINITRSDIMYLSQPYDTDKILGEMKGVDVIPSNIYHFPFDKFPYLLPRLPFNPEKRVDLSYGGTFRNGRREKKMLEFYFDHPEDISVEMFGKISSDDFKPKLISDKTRYPEFNGPVAYNEMLDYMNSSLSHCVLGDPWYAEVQDLPQRLAESVNSSVITFVDSELDVNRRAFGRDRELSEFLYVKSREELSEKIQLLKLNPDITRDIVEQQFETVAFNSEEYCSNLVDLIKVIS